MVDSTSTSLSTRVLFSPLPVQVWGREAHRVCSGGSAGETEGIIGLREVFESESKNAVDAAASAQALGAFVTAGEGEEITALLEVREPDFSKTDGPVIESHSRHNSSWGVGVVAGARVSALPAVSATASSSASAFVSAAGVAHARSTPMHDAHNSCSDTAMNSQRVQRSTSYSPQGVVSHNSHR